MAAKEAVAAKEALAAKEAGAAVAAVGDGPTPFMPAAKAPAATPITPMFSTDILRKVCIMDRYEYHKFSVSL